MEKNSPNTIAGRLAFASLGGLTGAIYGFLLAAFLGYFFTNRFSFGIIGWCSASFAFLGIFYDNMIVEAFTAAVHFIWGLVNGLNENTGFEPEPDAPSHFRALSLIGLVTGFGVLIAYHW